jgi:hypothetical protein
LNIGIRTLLQFFNFIEISLHHLDLDLVRLNLYMKLVILRILKRL